eukprot:63726-Pyramimonas_sp.AAC.1
MTRQRVSQLPGGGVQFIERTLARMSSNFAPLWIVAWAAFDLFRSSSRRAAFNAAAPLMLTNDIVESEEIMYSTSLYSRSLSLKPGPTLRFHVWVGMGAYHVKNGASETA